VLHIVAVRLGIFEPLVPARPTNDGRDEGGGPGRIIGGSVGPGEHGAAVIGDVEQLPIVPDALVLRVGILLFGAIAEMGIFLLAEADDVGAEFRGIARCRQGPAIAAKADGLALIGKGIGARKAVAGREAMVMNIL